jgi:hypothetical protein
MAVYWDDLAGNAGTPAVPSGVYWQQFDPDGTPGTGDEYTLISWENLTSYYTTGSLNFQVKFLEGSGSVEYHYGTITQASSSYANGLSATAWLESVDGLLALPISVNSALLTSNNGYRFTYTP